MFENLNDFERTLLLPLVGRARETNKGNSILNDEMSLSIYKKYPSLQELRIGEYSCISYAARARQFLELLSGEIRENPTLCCINLGAGLDTLFSLIDNDRIEWINIDFDNVIEIRERLFSKNERVSNVKGDVNNLDFRSLTSGKKKCVFIASGLFLYFQEEVIRSLLGKVNMIAGEKTVIFDRVSKYTLPYIQKEMASSGYRAEIAIWGIDDLSILESWDSRYKVTSVIPMFRGISRDITISHEIRELMEMNDKYDGSGLVVMKMVAD